MNGDQPVQPGSDQPEAPWQYKPEDTQAAPATPPGIDDTMDDPSMGMGMDLPDVTWTASEFIDHDKGTMWYVSLGGATLVVIIILYFFTHDFVSIVAVVTMAVLLGVVARRKPRVLEYHLDASGLTIGEMFHPYSEFKSFAILEDGSFGSIMLVPLKRFMPPISVYFSAENQQQIVDVVSRYLPMENREHDAIDRLSRRIRF